MSRSLTTVDASQVWCDSFFSCMDKLRIYDVEHANSAADFADAAVARFNQCVGAAQETLGQAPQSTYHVDTGASLAQSLLPGMINEQMQSKNFVRTGQAERVGDFERHTGPQSNLGSAKES